MWSLALCVLTISQAPATPAGPSPIYPGDWTIVANNQSGAFTLSTAKNNQIYGNMFDNLWTGTFDPVTKRVAFIRRQVRRHGESFDVQAYTGELTAITDQKPPVYFMKGTFKAIAGSGGGNPDIEYPWRADAIITPDRAEELARLQGEWEVDEYQTTAGTGDSLLAEAHLNQKGVKLTIRGNELILDGKLVATLANDLFMPNVVKDIGHVRRKPLMLTLPNGKAILCAYALRGEGIQIVCPHTIGNVGMGQFLWLTRTGPVSQPRP